ncbi:Peroxidasin -like protein [Halotydeus destructor]|nr:Peroxidasin -like protein [Halotydeus destructor]
MCINVGGILALCIPLLVTEPTPLVHESHSERTTLSPPRPQIVSRAQNITVNAGNTIRIDCDVKDIGSHNHSWTKGSRVLFANSNKVTTNSRYFSNGTSLIIRNIQDLDSGLIRCNLDTRPMASLRFIITVRDHVAKEPNKENVFVKQYDNQVLTCHHHQNRTIRWYFKRSTNDNETYLGHGDVVPTRNWTLSMSGMYICRTDGDVQPAEFRVVVQAAPEVQVSTTSKMAALGETVQLECTVKENFSLTNVSWRSSKSTISAIGSPRVTITSKSNVTTASLIFDRISQDDFGQYSCLANSSLGSALKMAEITMAPMAVSSTSFNAKIGNEMIAIISLSCLIFVILSSVVCYFLIRRRGANLGQSGSDKSRLQSNSNQKMEMAVAVENVYEEIFYIDPKESVYERKYLQITDD